MRSSSVSMVVFAVAAAVALVGSIFAPNERRAEAQALPDITLASTYVWDAAPGAAAYNVEVLNASNAPLNPPGIVQVVTTSIGVDQFLFVGGVIAPNGTYKFKVASVGPGGAPQSLFVQTDANFVGLGPPTNPRFE